MKKNNFIFLIILSFLIISCKNKNKEIILENLDDKDKISENLEENIKVNILQDTSIYIIFREKNNIKIDIKLPENKELIKGNLLMLHGWDCPSEDWCRYTNFCEIALDEGYILIVPEFGKTNYFSEIYPETYRDLQKYPTLTWIRDTMITELQNKFSIFLPECKNFVAGLSTGGRGATMLAYRFPEIITAVASVSGDFDISENPNSYLSYAYLGKYEYFIERWKKECFAFDCKNYIVPTYIAHGKIDNIAPVKNSIDMYDSIKFYHPEINLKLNINDTAKHNYNYWASETKNIIDFFNQYFEN